MKCSILGSIGTTLCQIPQLRDGFADLGHEHTPAFTHPDVAFVFVGNPDFSPYLDVAKEKKTIFNVLDCPVHVPEWPDIQQALKSQLPHASRVTAISKSTQRDLRDLCGIDSEVIYYPMKPVRFTGGKRYPQYKVAIVGRVADPGKRVASAVQALIRAGFNETEVAIVGPEYCGWGARCGILSDEALCDLYNSVDYVMMLSRFEGLGLPGLEAACCGTIPIVAPDCGIFDEFWSESPLGLHYQKLTSIDKVAQLLISLQNDAKWRADVKQDILGYAELAFRPKMDRKAVAARIISVYQTI